MKRAASKKPRGPFAHAADFQAALGELETALKRVSAEATRWARFGVDTRGPVGVPTLSASALARMGDDMIERGQRLRHACRRVLVAQYGLKMARRWEGWKPRRASREKAA